MQIKNSVKHNQFLLFCWPFSLLVVGTTRTWTWRAKEAVMRDWVDSCLHRDSWIVHLPCGCVWKASLINLFNGLALCQSLSPWTAFSARQVQVLVVPRTGRPSTSFFRWWRFLIDRNVNKKIRIDCVLINFYQTNESVYWNKKLICRLMSNYKSET